MSLLSVHFAVFRVFFNVELYDLENEKKEEEKSVGFLFLLLTKNFK